jgi:hypothetical protein
MIRPLFVEEGKTAIAALVVFGIGAVGSSTIVGFTASTIGGSLLTVSVGMAAGAVGAAAVILAAADLGILGMRTPTLRRQTQPAWWRVYGPLRASLFWGLDLGLGVTTIRITSLFWIALFAVGLLGDPRTGGALFSLYGLGLMANLSLGTLLIGRNSQAPNVVVLRAAMKIKTALAVLSLLLGGLLLAMSIA